MMTTTVQATKLDGELVAMLIQPRGAGGTNVFTVWTEDTRGKQRGVTVDEWLFNRIQDVAGEPSYTEPGYWTYDNQPIQWSDVFAEDRMQ